ncbi:MAG: FtsQ-type POTRA domain-containing protein [Proteobacteria bacterium]|nr:FtsQ-type POTRA domain-containing protein [Pseudomonadota bacterium]
MKKSIKSRIETKKNSLKRRSRKIFYEILKVSALIGTVVALTVLMIFAYNYMVSSPCFQIERTIIRGCERTTEKEILAIAGIKPSQNILAVNLGEMARRIEANPWVEDVSIGRELPNRLVIEISERKAVALVKRDKSFYFMDCNGVIFKKLKPGEKANLPILTGLYKNTALLKKFIDLITCLSSNNGFHEIRNVSEIHGDEIFGFSLFTNGGLSLRLGFENYGEKLKRLKPVMTDLTRRNLNKGFLHIDLSNTGRIVVQRKNVLKEGYST